MYVDHSGESVLQNMRTGDTAVIKFKALGFFQSKKHRGKVNAVIMDSEGNEAYEIYGKWTESLYLRSMEQSEHEGIKIWEFPEIPENWDKIYYFTDFTLQLNMLTEHLENRLPSTDARLRPDQRLLENGDFQNANNEKKRLEEKQRRRRKRMETENIKHEPRYFVRKEVENPDNKYEKIVEYKYLGNYWEDRLNQNWEGLPDLFGPDTPENSDEE